MVTHGNIGHIQISSRLNLNLGLLSTANIQLIHGKSYGLRQT